MLGIVSSFNAVSSGRSALQLLQSASITQTGTDGKSYNASASLFLDTSATAGGAIDTLIRILMDAQGNSQVEIAAKDAMATAETGDGNDTITIRAGAAYGISSGGGDDTIDIETTNTVPRMPGYLNPAADNIDSGDGNDRILIQSQGPVTRVDAGGGDDVLKISGTNGGSGSYNPMNFGVDNIDAGAGNDTMELVSTANASRIYGGAGDDVVDVKAEESINGVNGDAGNDTVTVEAEHVFSIDGGEGDDAISVTGSAASSVRGGAGDDRIVVDVFNAYDINGGDGNDTIIAKTEGALSRVSGGKGDDYVVIDSNTRGAASYYFSAGDGRDVIATNSPLEINAFSADGTQRLDMRKADITVDGDTVTIGFAGTTDSITVKLTGRMADAENVHVVYDTRSQSLVIADDQYFVKDPAPRRLAGLSENMPVGTWER